MLKNLSPLLSPDLLHVLASMGHGDEMVLADANFPATTHARRLVQLPGTSAPPMSLRCGAAVLPLDDFVPQAALTMQVVGDPSAARAGTVKTSNRAAGSAWQPPANVAGAVCVLRACRRRLCDRGHR
jgi:L-fucose mutarotase/ribose pyranase (RbsD/FucU family)